MNPKRIILASLVLGFVSVISEQTTTQQSNQLSESQGSGRYFNLLPPYYGIDFAANFNKLKSNGDIAYFVVRDSIAWLAINSFWVLAHTILWDGEATTTQDVITSLSTPGIPVTLSGGNSRLNLNSLSELSTTKLWNFFTNPDTSTRNLYLSMGFAIGAQILWILPTFFGMLPEKRKSLDRTLGVPEKVANADSAATWNRIFQPQGILQIVAINTLLYFGKMIFWTFMSNVPDVQADTVITGRSVQEEDSFLGSLFKEVMEEMKMDVEVMIDTMQPTQQHFNFY